MRILLIISMMLIVVSGCKKQNRPHKKPAHVEAQQKGIDFTQLLAGYMMFPELPLDAQNIQVLEVQPGIEVAVSYDSQLSKQEIITMYLQDMEWLGWDLVMQHDGFEQCVAVYRAPTWNSVIIVESIDKKNIQTKVQVIQKKKSSY